MRPPFGWASLLPKARRRAIVNKLNAEIAKVTGNAAVRSAWAAQGTTAMTMGVDEFSRYMAADITKWAQIVKVSGATAE